MNFAPVVVYLGLLGILAALVPLGLSLLRLGERLLGLRTRVTPPERALIALLAAGTLCFVLASIPIGIFVPVTIVALLVAGALAIGAVWFVERGVSLRPALSWIRRPAGLAVGGLFLLLLAVEVGGAGTAPFPNMYDGSFQTLFAHLTLVRGESPWTLDPYSATGVTYPQPAAVWLTLPVILLGWPLLASPVALPLLFLSMAVPAGYCWGERAAGAGTPAGTRVGLVFAASFAFLVSWPRFFIGGSYDFAIAVPFFMVAVGGLRAFVARAPTDWRLTVAFGLFVGAIAGTSAALGETLLLLLAAFFLVFTPLTSSSIARWIPRFLAIVGIVVAFALRSVVGVIVWWDYPQHVLSPVGAPPYAAQSGLPGPSWSALIGDTDPFTLFKIMLSPFPVLSLTLALLLVGGLVLLAIDLLSPRLGPRPPIPSGLSQSLLTATLVALVWTVLLRATSANVAGDAVLDNLASLYEASFVLFLFYSVIALLPLLVAAELLWARSRGTAVARPPDDGSPGWSLGPRRAASGRRASSAPVVLAVAVLTVPLALGGAITVVQAPGYLGGHVHALANVTSADQAALEWAGDHLPSCSRVLVAPGSAGMFLPLYASSLQIDFPMMPVPVNLSYVNAVDNLTHGNFTVPISDDLMELGITVVFVTAQNSVSYLPFVPSVFGSSPEFTPVFEQGDAAIYGFGPGEAQLGCPA